MLTIIARLKMRAGKEEEALERLRTMVSAAEAEEPGTLAYICHRSQNDPSEIIFVEMYEDDAALQAHGRTAHMGEFRSGFGQLFDVSQVKIERLERVAGFVRAGAG